MQVVPNSQQPQHIVVPNSQQPQHIVVPNSPQPQGGPYSPHPPVIFVQGSQARGRPFIDQSDQIRAYKVLGGIQIIIGLVFILFQIIYDALSSTSHNGYSGYWFGTIVLGTGVSAIVAIRTRSKVWMICFLILSILNCILGLAVMWVNLDAARPAFSEPRENYGWMDAIAAFAGIEGFIIAVVSTLFGCGGMGACICCNKPPLYKVESPPPPNYQVGQATMIQGQNGQFSLVQGQGQPMAVHGQGGVPIMQQPGYPQNIHPPGYMAPPPQYPQNVQPLQGSRVAPRPYQPHVQSQTIPSAPQGHRYAPQGRDALVHQRNARDYELPITPEEGYEVIPADVHDYSRLDHKGDPYYITPIGDPYYITPIGDDDKYKHLDVDKYGRPSKRMTNKGQQKEERYVQPGKRGKKY